MKWFMLFAMMFASLVRADQPVQTHEEGDQIILNNGVLKLTFSRRSGTMISLVRLHDNRELGSGNETMYWDANVEPADKPDGGEGPKKGYWRMNPPAMKLIANSPDRAEIQVNSGPDAWFKFSVELHWVLFANDSGFYHYAVIRHPRDQPAATFWQTRFVHKVKIDGNFNIHAIDDRRLLNINTSEPVETLMDATYRLKDGTVKTKYGQSCFWAQTPVYGFIGENLGIFSIAASCESQNGGPFKQGQTVHDNVLLRVMQSVHFGASPVLLAAGEEWSKVYGPFFTYVNGGADATAIWEDAKARQKAEAAKWPYQWVSSDAYVKQRGSINGQFMQVDSNSEAPAWIVLAQKGSDFATQSGGYQFWTVAKPLQYFEINNVIPGKYTLFISGGDQPEDFRMDDVEIKAGEMTSLDEIRRPSQAHGRLIFQLGTFDRSAAEFHDGSNARQFEMFRRYATEFPNDVDFTIEKSDPRKDWNYAQWNFYNKNKEWKLHFEGDLAIPGKAMLTIGIASAQPIKKKETDIIVCLNGKEIGRLQLPKTGTSGYRGGAQDSQYNLRYISFDASLIRTGDNIITFAHADAQPFPQQQDDTMGIGHVMYDAIKLEVEYMKRENGK